MAADYDKLFRPHEGMEAPDDMAAQPFFDPSASFPPAPASANLPKPNGQTPPPTSDDLSERFVSAPPPPPGRLVSSRNDNRLPGHPGRKTCQHFGEEGKERK